MLFVFIQGNQDKLSPKIVKVEILNVVNMPLKRPVYLENVINK